MALQPPPPPRGPLGQTPGAPPMQVQQPMQVLMTQDGQQVTVVPAPHVGLQPPQGMVQLQPTAQPQLQPQQLQPQMQPLQSQPMQVQQQQVQQGEGVGVGQPGGVAGVANEQTAALLRQVLSMSDEQINALPPEYRTQVLYVKEQIRLGAIKVE